MKDINLCHYFSYLIEYYAQVQMLTMTTSSSLWQVEVCDKEQYQAVYSKFPLK